MAAITRQRRPRSAIPSVIWPGFVDALAGVLLVLVFTISTFIVVQFFLRDELAGQSRTISLLESQISELATTLSLERGRTADLQSQLTDAITGFEELRSKLLSEQEARGAVADRARRLASQLALSEEAAIALTLELEKEEAEARRILNLLAAADAARKQLDEEASEASTAQLATEQLLREAEEASAADRRQLALLNRNIAALRSQLQVLQGQLDEAERKDLESEAVIKNLGSQLNAALSQKVSELARYRSEFFGRMREVLGDRADIRIVGDRFVLGSGVLFDSASAELGDAGQANLSRVADALIEITARIPEDVEWLVRVDGHTDLRPLRAGGLYRDNWDLSQARALSVVRYFVEERGLSAARFAATGFGPHRPIDLNDSAEAHAHNRRIELTLTSR